MGFNISILPILRQLIEVVCIDRTIRREVSPPPGVWTALPVLPLPVVRWPAAVKTCLGKPDQTTGCEGLDDPDIAEPSEKRQRSVHQYLKRWTTLDVHVIELTANKIKRVRLHRLP